MSHKRSLDVVSSTVAAPSKRSRKSCQFCVKQPSFGVLGTKLPLRCGDHREVNDVNVTSRRCQFCDKIPIFGVPGTKRTLRCGSHREVNDVDLVNKHCQLCDKIPNFGVLGTKLALRCGDHREVDDVNLISKHCQFVTCTSAASHGMLFSKPIFCSRHKLPQHYHSTKLQAACKYDQCKSRPCYTDQKDNYPLRCEEHALPSDKNVLETNCSKCGLMDYIRQGNVCGCCSLFEIAKREKRKEVMVKALLEAENIKFIYDRRPEGGCGLDRPDFVIDCGTHIFIIEVDEHQHRRSNYDCRCEQIRTINLFQEYGGLHVVFVRYNPDSYRNLSGSKCDGSSSANISRLKRLVHHTMNEIPKNPLTVRYLCFDNDDGTFEEHIIDLDKHAIEVSPIILS